jgi:hypothetical protein
MAVVITIDAAGVVTRHEVGQDAARTIPPCALAAGEYKHVRNTGKLQARSERCTACMAGYSALERTEGTREYRWAGGKDRKMEKKRVLDGIAAMTPAERKDLKLSKFARSVGVRVSDVKALSAAPSPAAPAKGTVTRQARAGAQSAAQSAAAAIAKGENQA